MLKNLIASLLLCATACAGDLPRTPHCYYDSLLRLPQYHDSWSLQWNQDAIDAITHATVPAADDNPCVTALANFASVTIFENRSSLAGELSTGWKSCQLRPDFAPISSGRAA